MKGITDIEFLLSYSAFITFVAYVSGLAGASIIGNVPDAPTAFSEPSITNILAPFGYFLNLLLVSAEYQIIFTLILSPALVVIVYIIIKALPFT